MAFKKDLTPLTKKGSVTVHKGKGATEERLPSRSAVNTLTGPDSSERSMNNYAKKTPNIQELIQEFAGGGYVTNYNPPVKPDPISTKPVGKPLRRGFGGG